MPLRHALIERGLSRPLWTGRAGPFTLAARRVARYRYRGINEPWPRSIMPLRHALIERGLSRPLYRGINEPWPRSIMPLRHASTSCTNASASSGSNWVPAQRSISPIATSWGRARR